MVIRNEAILTTAAQVLAKRPDATLQSIAHAAGISRTTIFNRYPTRDALVAAMGVDALQRMGQVMGRVPTGPVGDLAEVLLDVTKGLISLGAHAQFLYGSPGQSGGLDSHWEEAFGPLAYYFFRAQSAARLRRDQPLRWLVASYIGLLIAAWDEVGAGELGSAQAARLVVDTWMSAAAP